MHPLAAEDPPTVATAHQASLATLPAIIWEADPTSFGTTYVSVQAQEILGYSPEEWLADPAFWLDRVHPDDRQRVLDGTAVSVSSTAAVHQIAYRFRAADGTWRWFQDTVRLVDDESGRRLVGVMIDVTEARQAAELEAASPDLAHQVRAAAASDSQLREVLDNLADGVYYVDRTRRITYWNRGAEQLTGYRAPEVVGRLCFDNLLAHVDSAGTEICHSACPLSATMDDGVPHEAEVWLRHASGSRRAVHIRTAPVRDAAGEIVGAVEVFSDATGLIEAKDAAAAARRDAFTDPLTELPNRRLLEAVLTTRKDDLDRHRLPFGLLMIDIDHFKRFNDLHGHDVGDRALVVIADTLRAAVRAGDAVTRWGGEEFAIVAAQVDADGLARLGERILALIRTARVTSPAGSLPVRASIGAAQAIPGEPLPELFRRADQALLAAKAGGRDRVRLSAPPTPAGGSRILGARKPTGST